MKYRYRYTLITAIKPGILSKSFRLEGDNLIKSHGGVFLQGNARKRAETLQEFMQTLKTLDSHQALCYGWPRIDGDFATITLRELKGSTQTDTPVIAHIKEDFQYEAAPGLLLGDVDFSQYNKVLTVKEIQDRLYDVIPALRDQIPHVISHSASSWLYNAKTGELIKGEAGKHFYFTVKDAREIPAIGERLFQLLWLRGNGYNYLKSNGVWEPRALLDRKVWYQSCYDFAGGAWCDDPLEQRRPDPILVNPDGEPLSLDMLPGANKTRVVLLIQSDQEDREPERAAKEAEWLAKREQEQKEEYTKRGEQFTDEKRRQSREHLKRICEDQVLSLGDVVHSKRKGKVTVKEVLDHTDEFHETLFCDPADPEYNNGEYVAKAYLKGKFPFIHSFRSGTPTRYYLTRKPDEKRVETPAEMDLRHALADRTELAKHRDKLREELERPRAQGSEKETRKAEKALRDCDSKLTKLDRKVEKLQAKTKKRSPFTDDNGNSLYASQIADYLVRERIRDLLYDPVTDTWYRYRDGYHQVVIKHALQVYIRDIISETDPTFGFTPKMAGDITDCVSTLTVWPDDANELEKAIPFQNGVLRTDTMEFIAHRKEHWFRHVLPFDYAEGVELATEIREFFELIVDKSEHVELLQAIFRAIICRDLVAYQIFIVFIGDPGSGKSTIFDLMVEVVGERFTCATDLRRLEESPFEAAKFFGKKLAVIDDCHKYPGEIQRIKSIVTGGSSPSKRKERTP